MSRSTGRLVQNCFPTNLHFANTRVPRAFSNGNFALLCDRMGEFLYARTSLDRREFSFDEAVNVGRVAFGPRDLAVAKAMNNLALVLNDLNPNSDVEPLFLEALDIERERVGVEHPSYGRTLTS